MSGSRLLSGDGAYVDGLRALVARLGVVLDPGALGKRLEAVADDAGVMDEQVLARLVRRDEAEALVVVEPLHGSGCHCWYLHSLFVLRRGGAVKQRLRALTLIRRTVPALSLRTVAACGPIGV